MIVATVLGIAGGVVGVGGVVASALYLPPWLKQVGVAAFIAIGVGTSAFGFGYSHGWDRADVIWHARVSFINQKNFEAIAKAKLESGLKAQADLAAAQDEASKDAEAQRVANAQLQAALDALAKAPVAERDRKAPSFLVCAARGDCR